MNTSSARAWTLNGFKYWSLRTEGAEIVASITDGYTPYYPPAHAKYEVYAFDKKGVARFLGYLEGEQVRRAHICFKQAFAESYPQSAWLPGSPR